MQTPALLVASLALLFSVPAAGQTTPPKDGPKEAPKEKPVQPATLVQAINASPDHAILARLLVDADLADALKGKGSTTVFAPTDAAFKKLERERRGALRELAQKENRVRLVRLLSQHVVDGKLATKDLVKLKHATTLAGQRIDFTEERGRGLRIDGAKVERADIACGNGVLHVVDALLQPEQRGLVETLRAAGNHGIFLSLVTAADLGEILESGGPFTLIAPTDAAFSAMPEGMLDRLRMDGNEAVVMGLVRNHMLNGRIYADQAAKLEKVRTLAELELPVDFKGDRHLIKGVPVRSTDREAANGVVHVIDTLLLPR